MTKRRILLVDDDVAVLLTLKAVLEISGFDVDTAASAREAKTRLKKREYQMVITDMRMESDEAGREVIVAARTAAYHPAVALLTAFPVADDDWHDMGADKMLLKPMQTRELIRSIEKLLDSHAAKMKKLEDSPVGGAKAGLAAGFAAGMAAAGAPLATTAPVTTPSAKRTKAPSVAKTTPATKNGSGRPAKKKSDSKLAT